MTPNTTDAQLTHLKSIIGNLKLRLQSGTLTRGTMVHGYMVEKVESEGRILRSIFMAPADSSGSTSSLTLNFCRRGESFLLESFEFIDP
jgi:hypothetical protein